MTKMTYASALEIAIASVSDVEVAEKLTALKASLAKKSNGEKKPTKTQIENENLKGSILEQMENGVGYTVSGIVKNFEGFEDFSVNKVSALIRQLKLEGKVTRSEEKGVAYFFKVEG